MLKSERKVKALTHGNPNSLTNYEISDELEIPLSSVCARVRELQILNLVEDSGKRRETKYGKQAIVWQKRK